MLRLNTRGVAGQRGSRGPNPPSAPEATSEISANPVRNALGWVCRWLRECPVEVMFVSLGTHLMHSAYKAAENLQKDRHMTPKYTILF